MKGIRRNLSCNLNKDILMYNYGFRGLDFRVKTSAAVFAEMSARHGAATH
jgi:hypothetical protein